MNIKSMLRKLFLPAVLFILLQVLLHLYTNQDTEMLYGADAQTYHRISVFFTDKEAQSEEGIVQIKNSILDNLYQETGESKEEVKRMVYDTYSGQTKLQIDRKGRYYEVDAKAVGANYFSFHKMEFVEGNAFMEGITGEDAVVISESLAFKVFGSSDAIGQVLMSEGKLLVVCGVVKDENDFMSKQVEEELCKLYIPYKKAVNVLGEVPITSYEVVTLESMQGYAEKLVKKAVGIDEYAEENTLDKYGVEVIDQSSRFDVIENIKRMCSFHQRVIRTSAISYPEWENQLRIVELLVQYLYWGISFCILALLFDGCRIFRGLKANKGL